MTVRLYLDVDGVLNAYYAHKKWNEEAGETGRAFSKYDFCGFRTVDDNAEAPSFDMHWSKGLIRALNGLDVELVWLTTWRQDAFDSVGPLMGLEHVGRVLHPLSRVTTFPSITWKLDSLLADLEDNPSPFIWADDEIFDLRGQALYALKTLEEDIPHILVSPDSNFGITPADIERMQNFVRSQGDS